ncbi:MAG: diacylglycerol kinase family protein [Acholeplasmatales bacterium]|jgi:diacylglycerol kinase (ATP)|nr:diacylglycerol kinase family protein [Acholeplasmatales bacterium]
MKVCFICNPESGSGKITSYLTWIEEEFKKYDHEITLYKTEKKKDAYHQALLTSSYDMVLVAGGDGTLNEVIHLIGMKKRVKKTIKIILRKPVVKELDICKINDKYFVYVAAAGKFTKSSYDISRKSKKYLGRTAYFLRGSKELFKDYNIPIKVTSNIKVYEETSALILIMNGRRIGGLSLYNLKNKLDDGLMSLRSFKRERFMFLRVMLFFMTGGLYDTRKNRTFRDSYFKIETNDDVSWNIDGEYMGKGSIEVKVVPRAVKFIVNKRKLKRSFVKEK